MEGSTAATTAKQKSKLKGNKKEEKEKNPKGKVPKGKGKELLLNYAKFEGQGLSFKAKLFGFVEVPGPRGDQSSVQAIQKLKQQAKQMKKGANEHKLKIIFNITLQGVRLFNEKTQTIEHEHPIQKISFISHDPEDRHVFGYIYSPPRSAANEARKYYLFAIKSDKSADVITAQLYELFQVVYKLQENRKSRGKDSAAAVKQKQQKPSQPLEPLQDKMLLEMSNKIGGDQQSYPPDEHLYAEPTFVKRAPSEPPSEYAIPSDQPVQASNDNQNYEYQIPRRQNEISENENKDLTSGLTLPLNTNDSDSNLQRNAQPFSDNASTPSTNDDFKFDAAFESFPTEEISNQNTFHAEFPAFENGFVSSEKVKSPDGLPESPNDSEKMNTPDSNEIHGSPFSDQISFNAFGDLSSNVNVKTDLETSQNETASIDNEVSTASEPETEDVNSTKFENQAAEGDIEEISLANPTIGNFENEKQNKNSDTKVIETETSTTTETSTFVTQSSFEINFETENEDDKVSKQRQHDTFSFDSDSDAFSSQGPFASTGQTEFDHSAFTDDVSNQDPFASTAPTEFEQSAFTDDDPFSPKGGSNRDTKSDPFAENDDFFTAGFSDVNTNDYEQPKEDIFDEPNSRNDQYFDSSNKEEDIFEAMFEAKMDGEFGDETLNEDENKNEALGQTQVEFSLEKSSADDTNTENDRQEKEFIETLEENKHTIALPNKETTEPVEVQLSSDSPNNTISEEQPENVETLSGEEENVNEVNTFDFSSNDVYVTLKTAAPPSDRPLSPTEFSPPPLPPRSAPIIPKEPLNTVASPKIPPALPPRPSYQPSHTEVSVRKPPELPPRLDLEENGLVETQLVDSELETNTELFPNDTESPMFQASFDTFDFDNIENSSDSPAERVESPTAGFGSSDPFKDPFAGADPFQTPIAGDPFASSNVQPDNDDFDPFSGDDPFALTPAFDAQLSFGSPGNPRLSSSDEPNFEPNNDEVKDKFADFSTAFT